MNTNIKDSENMVSEELALQLVEKFAQLNPEQQDLLLKIMDLIEGRPDRRDFAAKWTGKPNDLPAALENIK